MPKKIRVAILDDHQGIIDGYLFRLRDVPDIEVVGFAHFGEELEALLAAHPADVLILDVLVPTAPDNSNYYPVFHALPRLLDSYPDLDILLISGHMRPWFVRGVMQAGASGYILKEDHTAISDLGTVIRNVARGAIYFSPQAAEVLFKRSSGGTQHLLTGRQREVLSLCAAYPDIKTADLAKRLGIASSTVRNELSDAYMRLGVRSRAAALAKARELDLITPLPPEIRPGDLGDEPESPRLETKP